MRDSGLGRTPRDACPSASAGCGQAPAHAYIDELITWLDEGKIRLDDIITHRLPLSEAPHGYKIFCDKADDCVKVVLTP